MYNGRTIETLFDLQEGNLIDVESYISNAQEVEIFQFRTEIEKSLLGNVYRYVCVYCKQPVVLRGRKNFRMATPNYYFSHQYKSKDCIIKTTSQFTSEQILAIKYNRVKESKRHIELKTLIAHYLSIELGKDNVIVEKVYQDSETPSKWRKPDVLAKFDNKEIAFELQLSTTFLTVIVQRSVFYQKQSVFLIWVFDDFSIETDTQRFTQKDVYYNNKQNVFLFDNEAKNKSLIANKLQLKCLYKKYSIVNNALDERWVTTFISLNEITYDQVKMECFYVDTENERLKLQVEIKKEQRKQETENRAQIEKEFNRTREIFSEIREAKEYIREIWKTDKIPQLTTDPIDGMWQDAIKALNDDIKLSSEYSYIVKERFIKRDRPIFLKYLSETKEILVNYNSITIDNEPLLQYISGFVNPKEFDHYIACIFAKYYSISYLSEEFIENLFELNKDKKTDLNQENIRRWGLICLLRRTISENSFNVIKHQKILLTLESIRINFAIDYKYDSLLQITHSFFDHHKEYSDLYLGALNAYGRIRELIEIDKNSRISERIKQFKKATHQQNRDIYPMVKQLFPAMNL